MKTEKIELTRHGPGQLAQLRDTNAGLLAALERLVGDGWIERIMKEDAYQAARAAIAKAKGGA